MRLPRLGARQQIDTCDTTSRVDQVVEYPCKCFARVFAGDEETK
jgi:hypothetical protein